MRFSQKELQLLYKLLQEKSTEYQIDSEEFRILVRQMADINSRINLNGFVPFGGWG
jgi:hypothetical protein